MAKAEEVISGPQILIHEPMFKIVLTTEMVIERFTELEKRIKVLEESQRRHRSLSGRAGEQ